MPGFGSVGKLNFLSLLVEQLGWDRVLNVFSVATTKCAGLTKPWAASVCFFVLLVSFFKTEANRLQVTTAFVLNDFFFL